MIRWPQDALTFAVKATSPASQRTYASYAAGYVEGDCANIELLGATPGDAGTELVVLREMRATNDESAARILALVDAEARVAASSPVFVATRDTFCVPAPLQPWTAGDGGADQATAVIVDELPGNIHAGDLLKPLFVHGVPPIGLALAIARPFVEALRCANDTLAGLAAGPARRLRHAPGNVVIGWDGVVRVQPHLAFADDNDDVTFAALYKRVDDVVEAAALLFHALTGSSSLLSDDPRVRDLRPDVPPSLAALIERCFGDAAGRPTLAALSSELDDVAREQPFSAHDLAGFVANLFESDRRADLEFREDLAAGDVDAFAIPSMPAFPLTPSGLAEAARTDPPKFERE